MGFWNTIFQAIIQGLTEFLPVSSSGHVSIYQHISGTNGNGAQTFTLFLHFGTLIAVFFVYRKTVADLILEFFRLVKDLFITAGDYIKLWINKYLKKADVSGAKVRKLPAMNETRRLLVMVVVASAWALLLFIPCFGWLGLTGADGDRVKDLSDLSGYFSEDAGILAEGLFLLLTGGLLLFATKLSKQREGSTVITAKRASAMGIAQCFAAMPGLSRSGTTTTVGMIAGLEKNTALNMSFIMSIPAVLAANLLEVKDLFEIPAAERNMNFTWFEVILGVVLSAVVGVLAIGGLRWIVKNDKLNYFGWYCFAMGTVIVIIAIIEYISGNNIFTGQPLNAALAELSNTDIVLSTGDISVTDLTITDITITDVLV